MAGYVGAVTEHRTYKDNSYSGSHGDGRFGVSAERKFA
jgi:hypothetical protein